MEAIKDARELYDAITVGLTDFQRQTGLDKSVRAVLDNFHKKDLEASDYEPCNEERLLNPLGEYFASQQGVEEARRGVVSCLSLLYDVPIGAGNSLLLFVKKHCIHELGGLVREIAASTSNYDFIHSLAQEALSEIEKPRRIAA